MHFSVGRLLNSKHKILYNFLEALEIFEVRKTKIEITNATYAVTENIFKLVMINEQK